MAEKHPLLGPPRALEVYQSASTRHSLSALDRALGVTTHLQADLDPLWEQWYQAISEVPLERLADDDIGRLLDVCMHLPLVLPLSLERLRSRLATAGGEEALACERLLLSVARAGRRLRDRAPSLAQPVDVLLEDLRVKWQGEEPASPCRQAWVRAADELRRSVPSESVSGWREMLGAPLPSLQEHIQEGPRGGSSVRSPHTLS